MTIEELIKLRKDNNIKQKDIAKISGYSITYVCMVEKGKYPLLKRFGVSYQNAIKLILGERNENNNY